MGVYKGGNVTYRESLIAGILQPVETAFWRLPAIVTCKRSESGEWTVNVAVPDRTIEVDDEYPSDSEVRDYAEGMINGMEVSLFNVIDAEYMLKRLADWFEMSAEPETNQDDIFEEEQT